MSSVMDRIRTHNNVGTNPTASTVASGYVSARGELIPFPSTNSPLVSQDVINTGRGGLVVLLAIVGTLASYSYLTRRYQK